MRDKNKYIEVAFPISLRRNFTYSVPEDISVNLYPGQRVVAPLRNVPIVGFIVKTECAKPEKIEVKPILEVIDYKPIFSEELFSFLQKLASYYLSPLGKVLSSAIPSEFQLQKSRTISLVNSSKNKPTKYKDLYNRILKNNNIHLKTLKKYFDSDYLKRGLSFLKKSGLVTESPIYYNPKRRGKSQKIVKLSIDLSNSESKTEALKKRAPRQWEVINTLSKSNGILKGEELRKFPSNVLTTLEKKGWVEIENVNITLDKFWDDYYERKKEVKLNSDQEEIYQKISSTINSEKFSPFLLQGVTGSGKTEIYIKLIKDALSCGRSVIVLVPEITLTTHLAGRFYGEFGSKITIWHSNLSKGERTAIWQSILRGDFPIVIGARSAIFLPLPLLGLIIVDEEQDASFKQSEQDPRYHARDAALLRGRESGATVLLGSATPSIESVYNSAIGKLTRLELPRRYSKAAVPIIHFVDLKAEVKETGNHNNLISRTLLDKIKEKTEKGEQVILLQNRRGYSNVILCAQCGWTPVCRNCDITLTYHKRITALICHYCNHIERPPSVCPECGGTNFLYPGFGTQRIESILKDRFPDLDIARLDMDTARQSGFSKGVMKKFSENQIQVLVGTQMIAKGLDFPNVSLVGVLNADIGLFMPDFRARERVFHLLYQVSGRVGRGNIQGEIVVQTFNPQNFTIQCALQKNIKKFFSVELNERNALSYPPFSRLALIQISDLNRERGRDASEKIAAFLHRKKGKIDILGPSVAPISKIKNRYRFFIILKSRKENDPNGTLLRNLLNYFLYSSLYKTLSKQSKISIDIDPLDIL